MDYQIQNPMLGQHMITHSLNRLIGHKTFGSGWKLYTRDYPHFIVEDNYTVVYDSTHVDPHLTKLSESWLNWSFENINNHYFSNY